MILDQVQCEVRVVRMDTLDGLGNRESLPILPNDLAMLGVDISFFQQHPDNVGHINRELPLVGAHPADKVVNE